MCQGGDPFKCKQFNLNNHKQQIINEAAGEFLLAHQQCAHSVDTMEFFFYLDWQCCCGRCPERGTIDVHMHVCCGYDATFGTEYEIPDSYGANINGGEYEANSVWLSRYVEEDSYTDDGDSWTEPSKFGVKQYVVFGISGLIFISCIVGAVLLRRWCRERKSLQPGRGAGYVKTPEPDHATQEMTSFPAVLPGPSTVNLPSHDDFAEASTDGNNRYTGRFIKRQGLPGLPGLPQAMHVVPSRSCESTPTIAGMPYPDPPPMLSQLAEE